MRLDHIAYRVKNRVKAKNWICKAFDYKVADKFTIKLEDGSTAKCFALKSNHTLIDSPEIFVSDGPKGSLIDKWVNKWGRGVGAIHHLAYQVDDVKALMEKWKKKNLAEFLSEEPLYCDGLVQIFTEPNPLTGIVYEFLQRTGKGFCKENVGKLMDSTKDI